MPNSGAPRSGARLCPKDEPSSGGARLCPGDRSSSGGARLCLKDQSQRGGTGHVLEFSHGVRHGGVLRVVLPHTPALRPNSAANLLPRPVAELLRRAVRILFFEFPSSFEFRCSDFFRISDFDPRISDLPFSPSPIPSPWLARLALGLRSAAEASRARPVNAGRANPRIASERGSISQ
jgi:hypothetical protein